jgi:putative membrane protein
VSDAVAPDQRLHPLSWLFVLLQQLRQFLIPLLALLLFGQREGDHPWSNALASALVIAVLVAHALLQYFTYRYRIAVDAVTVRSGWLQRSSRDIPFARIHNVVVHQSALHRLFGVAEVRLESAGGSKPEAELRVLRLDRALELERQIRQGSAADAGDAAATAQTLLALSTAEVVRLGLISNRGMVVVAAAFGVIYQMFPQRVVSHFVEQRGQQAWRYLGDLHPGLSTSLVAGALLLLMLLAAMRGLSVLLALTRYHGFRLSESERRLTVERGLLARLRTSIAQRRIQAWTLQESLLHRLFGRRRLRVDTAVIDSHGEDSRALRELAPVATPADCDRLVRILLPEACWPPPQWQPVPRRGWWRLSLPSLWLLPVAALLALRIEGWALLVLAWWPWSLLRAWLEVRRMAWSLDARLLAVRGGWWTRWWRFAELGKLQALQLARSPLDHLLGTATLWLDTAGAGGSPPLRLRHLPLAQAEALQADLARRLAQRRLEW